MSHAEVQRFAGDLKTNAGLLAEARRIALRPMSELVELASRNGYRFTVADVRALVRSKAEADGEHLSDERLDTATYATFSAKASCLCSAGRGPQARAMAALGAASRRG